ncbi:MAG: cell division protein FtsQ/DivIB [bacterium]|nr:cell division protein FtsQ/DivIB [bacterium]
MREEPRGHRRMWMGGIIAIVCLAMLLLLSVRIQTITVTGNHKYSEEEVEELLFAGRWDKNVIYCYLKDRFGEHESLPFVQDYKLLFHNPLQLEVIVHEKAVIGYVSYMGSNMYFDKDGIIVESSREVLSGVPLITGLRFGHIVLYQPLPVTQEGVFRQILNLTQLLNSYEIAVDKIYYDSNLHVTMTLGDIVVELGNSENLNGKIQELSDILPVLEGQKGSLDLSAYDANDTDQWFSFKKKEN